MSVWYWVCPKCNAKGRALKQIKECPQCKGATKHDPQGMTFQKKESLDNGAMGRTLERLDDIEDVMKEYVTRDTTEREE